MLRACEPKPRQSPHGSGAAEQLRAHQDHVGIRLPQRVDAEAEAVERAGSEVLDHDVALADELEHEATALAPTSGRRRSSACPG